MKGKNLLLLLGGLLVGVLLGLAILYGKTLLGGPGEASPSLKIGSSAPDFELTGLDGKIGRLSDYRGRTVVMNFWASWCIPCRSEMPLLESYFEKYSDQLVVIGINEGETAPIAAAFVKEVNASFPIFLDEGGLVGSKYRVRGYPTTVFIDAQGVIQSMHIGELDEELMNQYLPAAGLIP